MSQDTGSEKKEQIVKQLAEDYAKYFIVDTTQERGTLDHELESMLTRLEEYGSLLDRTRAESRHTLDVLVPQVYSHYQALQRTFQTIDNLETLVTRVKNDLGKMEASVEQAEADLGPSHGLTTVIRPLFFKRDHHQTPRPTGSQLSFQPPEIFHTQDFFETSEKLASGERPKVQS
ncbi:biogenesis of lysosome-related organelles complex 1 subunit 4-like [Penaeus japonicus]|uniref:biogenesis of lysosome-related organelles complex 1 subunit 4-like n=1 Tax=Penaeus japonicus TaxID=27405 RepID=UPI001C7146A8|nr:biogenesis of lysosome-related organelles complex 1 subunit 4-like [Penaeus japonicus]